MEKGIPIDRSDTLKGTSFQTRIETYIRTPPYGAFDYALKGTSFQTRIETEVPTTKAVTVEDFKRHFLPNKD